MAIEDWVYRHFDSVSASGTELIVRCPFCKGRTGSEDRSGHLYISSIESKCHCFRCGYGASWYGLVKDITGSSYAEIKETLEEDGIVPLYRLLREQKEQSIVVEMPNSFQTIAYALSKGSTFGKKLARSAARYVKQRVAPYRQDWSTLLERWGIWSSLDGLGKLVLPVERGWWQERDFSNPDPHPKYLSPHVPKEDRLYNGQALNQATVYITEGIISAACIGEDAVALCAKEATKEQLDRLCQADVARFVVCLDADAVADAIVLAKDLHARGKEVYIRKYAEGDPASCSVFTEIPFTWQSVIEMRLR